LPDTIQSEWGEWDLSGRWELSGTELNGTYTIANNTTVESILPVIFLPEVFGLLVLDGNVHSGDQNGASYSGFSTITVNGDSFTMDIHIAGVYMALDGQRVVVANGHYTGTILNEGGIYGTSTGNTTLNGSPWDSWDENFDMTRWIW
jgi:hypothetical protein